MGMDLNQLLDRVKVGDAQAFQELYDLYYKRIYYFALQLSKNSQDAQDIAQETFIQLQKSLPSLKDNRAFSSWLHRITISKAGTIFRKNKTVPLPDSRVLGDRDLENRRYMLPSETIHFNSDKEMLDYFLQQLDEKYRIVLVMSYFSNLKIKEIAQALDIAEGTVKSRISTGKELLKKKIELYQKREGVRLDFKSADMAGILTAFFIAQASELAIPKIPSISMIGKAKHMKKSYHTQIIGGCLFFAILLAASYGVNRMNQNVPDPELPNSVNLRQNMQYNFPSVPYNNQTFYNPEDIYYQLLKWAHCGVEMRTYTMEERKAIEPLYQALKNEKGVYWKELMRKKWNQEYEDCLRELSER